MTIDKFIQKIRENWKVKVICILLAVITYIICQIAFLDRKSFVVVPKIENSSNLTYVNDIRRSVRISVRGLPTEIDSLEGKDFETYIDLSKYAEPGTYKVPVSIKFSEKATNIEKIEVSVNPKFVELVLESKETVLVPLKVNLSGTCAKGYEISSYALSPSFVQVTGSKALVEKTSFLETSPINVDGKSSDFTQQVDVINYNNRLSISDEKEIFASVNIKPIKTTKQLESSVVFYYSLKDGLAVENSNIPYKVTLSGNKNELDKFVLSPLSVQVDCSSIETSGSYALPFSVVVPDGITVDKIEPEVAQVNIVDFVEIPVPKENEEITDETSTTDTDEQIEESKTEDNLSLPITE
jgi:YbbR domain-containing protein